MRLRNRPHFTLLLLALQVLVLNSACSQQPVKALPELEALRAKLTAQYQHQDIRIISQNSNVLGIAFVNSPFNNLEDRDQGKVAEEVGVFVTNHYAPINKVDSIWVSFVTSETYFFIFQYTENRTFQFDRDYLARAGMVYKPAESVLKARASYSEAQDATTVLVNNLQLDGDLNKGLILIPSFSIRGKKVSAPAEVTLEFASYEDRKMYAENRTLSIRADNKTVASGTARLISSGKTTEGLVSEFLTYQLTYQQFLQVVDGRQVELKLGAKEIRLTPEHLRLLREMKKCVDAARCE